MNCRKPNLLNIHVRDKFKDFSRHGHSISPCESTPHAGANQHAKHNASSRLYGPRRRGVQPLNIVQCLGNSARHSHVTEHMKLSDDNRECNILQLFRSDTFLFESSKKCALWTLPAGCDAFSDFSNGITSYMLRSSISNDISNRLKGLKLPLDPLNTQSVCNWRRFCKWTAQRNQWPSLRNSRCAFTEILDFQLEHLIGQPGEPLVTAILKKNGNEVHQSGMLTTG